MISSSCPSYKLSFLMACGVALILLTAATLKWVSPPSHNPLFYMLVGGVEAVLAAYLLLYYKSWRVWIVLALAVSLWMGSSLYVTVFDLPCSCMGEVPELPRGTTLILNIGMFLGALTVLARHPEQPIGFRRIGWYLGVLFLVGFLFSIIYYNQ